MNTLATATVASTAAKTRTNARLAREVVTQAFPQTVAPAPKPAQSGTRVTAPKPAPVPVAKPQKPAVAKGPAPAPKAVPVPQAKPAPVKEPKVVETRPCLCGCGTECKGDFAPGHDTRAKGETLLRCYGSVAEFVRMHAGKGRISAVR